MNRKLRELWVVVTDDRRKATMLAGLLIVLVGLGVKSLVDGAGPRGSRAALRTLRSASRTLGRMR
jgi:hypothetical protein